MIFLFIQFILFLVQWLYMIAGIFHIVRRYCYQFRLVGQEMATIIGYAVARFDFHKFIFFNNCFNFYIIALYSLS